MASRYDISKDNGPQRNPWRMGPARSGPGPFGPRPGSGYNPFDPENYDARGFGFGEFGPGEEGAIPDSPRPVARRTWMDAFPHEWKGWGPQTLDDAPDTAADNLHEQMRRVRRQIFDDQYLSWREEQMRKLDEDYFAYRQEHQGKFNDEFNAWRKKRAANQPSGPASETARSAGAAKPEIKGS